MKEHARREFIAGLRSLAAFYESRPDAYYDGMRVTIGMYAPGRHAPQVFAAMAAAFAEEDGRAALSTAPAADQWSNGCFCGTFCCGHAVLTRNFSAKVRLELFASRVSRCQCSRSNF